MNLCKYIVLSENVTIMSQHDSFEDAAHSADYMATTLPGQAFKVYNRDYIALKLAKPKVRMLNKKEPA